MDTEGGVWVLTRAGDHSGRGPSSSPKKRHNNIPVRTEVPMILTVPFERGSDTLAIYSWLL